MNDIVERRETGLVANEPHRFSVAEIRQRVNLVQEVMRGIMKKETHYGVIPGTQKPTLYKAGAEQLCATFRIAPKYRIEDLSTADCARFRITCIGVHQTTGIELGEGVGECSSSEEKYKWRRALCAEEFDVTPENMRRLKFKKYKGNIEKETQIRTEPADLSNTVLKMAAKRAMIAMTLNVTAASDIFTQDIEDLPEELRQDEGPATPIGDPALMAKWVEIANGATEEKQLATIWTNGLKEIKAANDMPAYQAFKAAVEARGKAIKNASPPDAEFLAQMDAAEGVK
jgi:hypothetical protein